VDDKNARRARIRHTAMGALATLAAVGAIAGTAALATNKHGHAAATTSTVPDKTQAHPPAADHKPFFDAIQQLVDNGTITAAQGQAVDREIDAGRIDTATLASSGLTATQLEAVEQALGGAKSALAAAMNGTPKQGGSKGP
jgi:hypothetical protein